MDRFESMSAFVAVVETGGFSAAARRLRMPLTSVSRKVAEIEAQLQVRLLTRTTRKVTLTETGQSYFEMCRRVLTDINDAERLASGEYQAPKGGLVASAPLALGRLHLSPILGDFLFAYPDIDVELRLGDRVANVVEEGVDVALRVGALPDSSLKAVNVGRIRHVVAASPAYLARRGEPSRPRDLESHHCVTFTGLEGLKEWTFRLNGRTERLTVRSRIAVNTAEAAADAAIAGVGITRQLCYQVSSAVLDGRLNLVLRGHEPAPLPVSLVYPDAPLVPRKLRAFLDFVTPRLKTRLIFNP